jgi:hypothetical protein
MLACKIEDGGPLIIGAKRNEHQLVLYTRIEGYTSRIIGLFGLRLCILSYRLTQGVSHTYLTRRFLQNIARILTGK